MKLKNVIYVLLVVGSIVSGVVIAHDNANRLPYIECVLRQRERSSSYTTHPHIPAKEGTSQNWSGYVAATNFSKLKRHTVMAVYGSWIVPTLSQASRDTGCALWVGIDGYGSNTIEQLGTEHNWHNGQQQDYAWFAMAPNSSYEIVGFPARPGDVITASIEYEGNDVFLLSIANITAGVRTTISTSYTTVPNARRACAEWILEAPFADGILPLSHFNTAYFSNCATTISYMHGPINNKHWKNNQLTMVTADGVVKAVPTALSNGQAFNVVWYHE